MGIERKQENQIRINIEYYSKVDRGVMPSGFKTLELSIEIYEDATLGELKEKIESITGLKPNDQLLTRPYGVVEGDNNTTLKSLSIKDYQWITVQEAMRKQEVTQVEAAGKSSIGK